MSELRYLGPNNQQTPLTNTELRDKNVETVTQAQITSAIDNELVGKASASYLDSSVAGKVRKTDLPSYGNARVAKTTANKPNGPVALSGGRVPNAFAPNVPGGRPWRNFGDTPSWNIQSLTNATIDSNPVTVAVWSLPDIGYSYLPIFIGSCKLGSPNGAELQIRQGSASGPIVARAVSSNSAFFEGRHIVPSGGVQAIRSGTFYIVAGRKFSGQNSAMGTEYSLSCFGVPA